MIATDGDLAKLVAKLDGVDRVAIDTEADSLHCYFEKLCLIQISIPGHDFLVDPLADFSLEPLYKTLPAKELILHGADFDLRLMRRAGQMQASRIFDTMIAARLVGRTEFSLAALIAHQFGVTLAKGSQKANWARRPLPPHMAEYAVNDTRYLLPLAEKLSEDLRQLGRWEWFEQSCEKAIASANTTRERDLENAWRISGSSDLQGRAAAILRALWNWRDEEARRVDRPAFHILHNEQLIVAARGFDEGRGAVPGHVTGSRRKRFFEVAERALQLPEADWPKPVRTPRSRPTVEEQRLFQEYKKRRDEAATRLGLDPSLIAPKATIEALAGDFEQTRARLLPWQSELLGIGS